MGGQESKPTKVEAVEQENSSGFHFVEIHMPTAGVSIIVIIIIFVIFLGCRRLMCFGRSPRGQHSVETPPFYASPPQPPPPTAPYGYFPQPMGWQSDAGWNRGLQGLALPLLTHIQELASKGVERCHSPPPLPARRPRATIAEVGPGDDEVGERREAEAQTPRTFAA
jgi:hypothetical protein